MICSAALLLGGSMFLGLLSLTGMWFLSKKYRWAWLIYAAERALCIPYDIMTLQWGFVILDASSVVIAIKAYIDWKPETTETDKEMMEMDR